MQRLFGFVIGCLLGVMLAAGVVCLLAIAWYFVSLLSLANVPWTKEVSETVADHAMAILGVVLLVCCGGLGLLGFRQGMQIYTSVDI